MNFFTVYISPAGTTRRAADIIGGELAARGRACPVVDLGDREVRSGLHDVYAAARDACLFIGSPVYAGHAVPAVMDFIAGLPAGHSCLSVPFVTWGAVTSGVALFEMAKALEDKGYPVAAAAKIVAEHSLLWQSVSPLAQGRPGADDAAQLRMLVKSVLDALKGESTARVASGALNYQREALQQTFAGLSVRAARKVLPQIVIHRERCTLCGQCAEACPVDAVRLDDGPLFDEGCIACYTCLRACPEQALQADFTRMQAGLEQRQKDFAEASETVVYLPC